MVTTSNVANQRELRAVQLGNDRNLR